MISLCNYFFYFLCKLMVALVSFALRNSFVTLADAIGCKRFTMLLMNGVHFFIFYFLND